MTVAVHHGDCREILPKIEAESVHCCVTSPPYWGLRDYGVAGQLGLERTPNEYIAGMVGVFREVRRVLRADGTLWLNMGDSYAGSVRGGYAGGKSTLCGSTDGQDQSRIARGSQKAAGLHETACEAGAIGRAWVAPPPGLKQKDLCGIPWALAFALRDDGWYLRSDIIWNKSNGMPESVTDRPTKNHEYIFLLAKSERYYCNMEAIMEDCDPANGRDSATSRRVVPPGQVPDSGFVNGMRFAKRNKRTVWTVPTQPFPEAHFATFPEDLIKPCILAGCPAGGTVLDPFYGAGTTGLVARALGCNVIGIDINAEYLKISARRLSQEVLALEAQ